MGDAAPARVKAKWRRNGAVRVEAAVLGLPSAGRSRFRNTGPEQQHPDPNCAVGRRKQLLRAANAGRGVGKARKPRAGLSSPSGATRSPDLLLIPFHESPSLVSFSSPTGSGEMELIMFRIEEKSGTTGPPLARPARDRDSAGPGGMRVLPAGGG